MIVKIYHKCHPDFPDGGKMSRHLYNIKPLSVLNIRGPFGRFRYLGDGKTRITRKLFPLTIIEKTYSEIGMIAAGTGITPMFQILHAAHIHFDKIEKIVLFYGNRSEKDILLREDLERMDTDKRFNFNLILMIDKQDINWDGLIGHFDKEKIKKYMPKPSESTLILTCGPPKLCREILIPSLKEIGHKDSNLFDF